MPAHPRASLRGRANSSRLFYPKGKIAHGINPSKICIFVFHLRIFVASATSLKLKISYVMSKTSQITRIELLKQLKSNVNSFVFSPSESKLKAVNTSMAQLAELLSSVEIPTESPKPKSKKRKASSKKTKAVRSPRKTSDAGLEQAQAKQNTANKVGKVGKTKVVHAITEGEPQPFEPRKEVPVIEPKARKKQQMKVTLLPGESPEEAMARLRSAEIERLRLEAEALIAEGCPTSDDLPF